MHTSYGILAEACKILLLLLLGTVRLSDSNIALSLGALLQFRASVSSAELGIP